MGLHLFVFSQSLVELLGCVCCLDSFRIIHNYNTNMNSQVMWFTYVYIKNILIVIFKLEYSPLITAAFNITFYFYFQIICLFYLQTGYWNSWPFSKSPFPRQSRKCWVNLIYHQLFYHTESPQAKLRSVLLHHSNENHC